MSVKYERDSEFLGTGRLAERQWSFAMDQVDNGINVESHDVEFNL